MLDSSSKLALYNEQQTYKPVNVLMCVALCQRHVANALLARDHRKSIASFKVVSIKTKQVVYRTNNIFITRSFIDLQSGSY